MPVIAKDLPLPTTRFSFDITSAPLTVRLLELDVTSPVPDIVRLANPIVAVVPLMACADVPLNATTPAPEAGVNVPLSVNAPLMFAFAVAPIANVPVMLISLLALIVVLTVVVPAGNDFASVFIVSVP